jgi:hypothetical protein
MSLFRPVTILQPVQPLAGYFRNLTSICANQRRHPLPVRRAFIGFSTSDHGAPMAVYACQLCNSRVAYVRDFMTGKPRQLFAKN